MAGIYIHIPFCESKCIYCDFFSVTSHKNYDIFVKFLKKEIEMYNQYSNSENIETIYIGGGTPSLLTPDSINDVLTFINNRFKVTEHPEITLEINPGTVDLIKLKKYKEAGINRLSIGIQSFNDDDLKFLSRIHTVADARRCYDDARNVLFDNIGIDLIFAVPSQTIDSWKGTLEVAVNLEPQHISAYNLSFEEGTPIAGMLKSKKVFKLPEDIEIQMMEYTIEKLTSAGYLHYEVSNFAKPNYQSRHNCNYWNHSNYLGFGPSAHSYWNGRRWWNIETLMKYYSRIDSGLLPIKTGENLTRVQLINEIIMLGLRSTGVNLGNLRERFNFDYKTKLQNTINYLLSYQLAYMKEEVLSLTRKGMFVCDEISKILVSDLDKV